MTSRPNLLYGAIAGDIIGSVYEFANIKNTDFALFQPQSDFTDDTVLTVAVADALLRQKNFGQMLWQYGRNHPGRGYGGRFAGWLQNPDPKPYHSLGNGSAMRVSPVAYAFDQLETVLQKAEESAACTHNHIEGIKGAQATAAAIFLARKGQSKNDIKKYIVENFHYRLDQSIAQIRPNYGFDATCPGSVPQAIMAFLESSDYESAIRLAISLGGDSDTIACICGGMAAAFYQKIPAEIADFARGKLPADFVRVLDEFFFKFGG